MRSPNNIILFTAVVFCLMNGDLAAIADTRIRGEFEYNVDKSTLSEWKIGPAFQLDESTELEVPIGQEENTWLVRPELTYEIEANDTLSFEFSLGVESKFVDGSIEGFGGIEGRVDF